MNIETFLIKNPHVKPAAIILSAPFFEYSKLNNVSFARSVLVKSMIPIGEELIFNPVLQAHWVCHDKKYWKRLNELDGTQAPFVNARMVTSMGDSIRDIKDNAHKHEVPVLIMLAGKDKIVDNQGARDFYAKIKTPADKK